MKGIRFIAIGLYLLIVSGCALPDKAGEASAILKQYHFSELDSLFAKEQRPVAIFLHAEWCKFCKNMEQTTFQNETIIELLNEKYYLISFDGEQKEEVSFRGHLFNYQPTGRNTGTHELATALGSIDNILAYPTFILLNSKYEIIFQHNTFLNSKELKEILERGVEKQS